MILIFVAFHANSDYLKKKQTWSFSLLWFVALWYLFWSLLQLLNIRELNIYRLGSMLEQRVFVFKINKYFLLSIYFSKNMRACVYVMARVCPTTFYVVVTALCVTIHLSSCLGENEIIFFPNLLILL